MMRQCILFPDGVQVAGRWNRRYYEFTVTFKTKTGRKNVLAGTDSRRYGDVGREVWKCSYFFSGIWYAIDFSQVIRLEIGG